MPELFAEMRQDLSESPFIREFIGASAIKCCYAAFEC